MRSTRSFPKILMLLAGMLLCLPAAAQMDSGRVTGVVQDESGGAIPGANVTIRNERTGEERTTRSSGDGQFLFTALKPSTYLLRAESELFQTGQVSLQLAVGQQLQHAFSLRVAGDTREVNVTDTIAVTVDTTSARVGANVSQREVNELPINGRQLSQLYLQAPGSQNSGSGTFGDIRFSGRSVQQNAIRYDGVEGSGIFDASPGVINASFSSPFRLQSSLENVQEFRVESSNYPAEYGTGTGGQISVVTKSGSNSFHGSAFEYIRNDALDASNYFDLPGTQSKLRQNQFGASLGGPIVKNKLFFFGSYEGYRLRSSVNFVEAVPSSAACARAVAAVAQLCTTAFRGPGAVVLPGASTNADFEILQLQANNNVNENAGSVRLDYKVNDAWTIYTRFFRDQGTNDQPEGVTGRRSLVRAVPQNGVFSVMGVLSPTIINETKFGYNSALTRVIGSAPNVGNIDMSAITLNITGSVANTGIAGQGASSGIAVPGGLLRQNSASNGRGAPITPYSLSFIDNLTWVRGD
ncbi:MAG: carboxypeptidase regulatory-like domain-containing protein, partial [Candidatus Korobacteraceae bacterium]